MFFCIFSYLLSETKTDTVFLFLLSIFHPADIYALQFLLLFLFQNKLRKVGTSLKKTVGQRVAMSQTPKKTLPDLSAGRARLRLSRTISPRVHSSRNSVIAFGFFLFKYSPWLKALEIPKVRRAHRMAVCAAPSYITKFWVGFLTVFDALLNYSSAFSSAAGATRAGARWAP